MTRVAVQPEMLRWARERARMDVAALEGRFPRLSDWESRRSEPTLKQLENYARVTHAPIGYLFLETPPEERVPIPDFRTMAGRSISRPSPNLLETIYVCQERQAWYRDFAQVTGQQALQFVGSMTTNTPAVDAANAMRVALGFDLSARAACSTWEEALRLFIEQTDMAGVMVMVSGVVLNNNYRHLDPSEFRGFALSDNTAPLVFVNGADTKSAQMFTLAHELAHIWLGESALSDATAERAPSQVVEAWCNNVAAELLVPLEVLRSEIRAGEALENSLLRLARRFKVSTLVVLRRLFDAGQLRRPEYSSAYEEELSRLLQIISGSGGSFYRTTASRVSKRFARALVESTLEGRTLYRDAFRMLGVSKTSTFNEFGRSLGFPI